MIPFSTPSRRSLGVRACARARVCACVDGMGHSVVCCRRQSPLLSPPPHTYVRMYACTNRRNRVPPSNEIKNARLLVNEQEIASAVGSAALQQRRRGAAGLWLSLERRGRMHLLLCADLVRFYREDVAEAAAAEVGGRDGEGHPGSEGGGDGGGGEGGGKRKAARSAAQDSGSSSAAAGGRGGGGGARKRPRATDPWEDILVALNPHESLGGRSSSIPGGGSGR